MGLISKVTAPVTALLAPAPQQPPLHAAVYQNQPPGKNKAAEPVAGPPATVVPPASPAARPNAAAVVLAASQVPPVPVTAAPRDEVPKGPPPARVPLSGYGPDATLDEARAGAEAARRAYRQDQIIASVGVVAPTQGLAVAKATNEVEAAKPAAEPAKPWAEAHKPFRAA